MVKRIIDFSLDNRMIVIVGWLLIVAIGINAMLELPIDAVPDVTNVQVQVLTNSPGLAPEEVEKFITFPVETSMSGIPNVEEIRSVSKFGLSAVTIVFEEGTDIYWARQLIGERLVDARAQIPEGYGEPEMGPISTGLGEIYQFEVRGDGMSPMELRTILDWNINYQLRTVRGVVEVNAFGGELKTYQVTLDDTKLAAYGLGVGDVMESVRGNNRNVGGGYIEQGGEQYLIRGEGLIESLHDLGEIVVSHGDQGTPVYVRDLGTVEFAPMIRQGAVTRDGKREAVVGIVMMLIGENSRIVARDVDAKIKEIRKTLPEGVTIDTFYDRTELVDRTVKTVAANLLEGGVLVVIVLLLLVGSLRAGLLVAASIPLSMMIAFTIMRYVGISGNLMSLGALDFGIIVDGTVVVIENIMRYLAENKDQVGVSHREKVRRACHEIARPVVFAVSIIMIVYLPVLALRGIEGKMFGPMALTVVFAMAGSLFCAITLMPVLATFFLKNVSEKEPILLRWASRLYAKALSVTMERPARTATVAGSIFVGSLFIVPFLGAEFMPRLDEGAIAMQIWRLPSISLEKSNEISMRAERVVMEFPEVKTVVSRTGRPEIATDPMGVEISDTYIILHPPDTWRFDSKAELLAAIDEQLQERVPGAIFSYSQPIELRVAELISGVRSDIGIKIFGDDIELMKEKADEIVAVLRDVRGISEPKAEQTTGLPMMRVKLRRDEIARLGINAEDVLEVIEAVGGKEVSTVFEGQKRFALQIRFGPEVRHDLERIGDLRIKAPGQNGTETRLIPLSQLADITVKSGAAQISREKISRRTTVEANVRGRDLASTVKEAQQKIEENVELPSGWYLEWGGQFENLEQAAGRLVFLVPLALLLIFMLLYGVFQSAALGTLIFLNVPLAVTGGVVFLALRGYPLSISAGVGFIALFGIAVMNGVVLVSSAQQLRSEGMNAKDASHKAAKMRLRPVLMTALTDMIGFVPMAMATSAGAEVQRPLATVVIGGLVTASLLTLLVLPTIYRWFAPKVTGVEL